MKTVTDDKKLDQALQKLLRAQRQNTRKNLLDALDGHVRSPQVDDFVRELIDEVIPEEAV